MKSSPAFSSNSAPSQQTTTLLTKPVDSGVTAAATTTVSRSNHQSRLTAEEIDSDKKTIRAELDKLIPTEQKLFELIQQNKIVKAGQREEGLPKFDDQHYTLASRIARINKILRPLQNKLESDLEQQADASLEEFRNLLKTPDAKEGDAANQQRSIMLKSKLDEFLETLSLLADRKPPSERVSKNLMKGASAIVAFGKNTVKTLKSGDKNVATLRTLMAADKNHIQEKHSSAFNKLFGKLLDVLSESGNNSQHQADGWNSLLTTVPKLRLSDHKTQLLLTKLGDSNFSKSANAPSSLVALLPDLNAEEKDLRNQHKAIEILANVKGLLTDVQKKQVIISVDQQIKLVEEHKKELKQREEAIGIKLPMPDHQYALLENLKGLKLVYKNERHSLPGLQTKNKHARPSYGSSSGTVGSDLGIFF